MDFKDLDFEDQCLVITRNCLLVTQGPENGPHTPDNLRDLIHNATRLFNHLKEKHDWAYGTVEIHH